jgi:hypothetical protein
VIRQITSKDSNEISLYLVSKLNIPFSEAEKKVRKIIKSGLPSFLLEAKDLQGICYVEHRIINDEKTKFVEILCDNWRLAEMYIKILRWNLNGIYWMSLPKHDFLNRTFNKNGLRFTKCDGNKNIYCYRFEKRNFVNFKSEDNDEQ